MSSEVLLLVVQAIAVYILVLATHALRRRFGLAFFYALLGGMTAIMSWVTDAGVQVTFLGATFMVGSTVYYTSLLLGVFVVYVFDGPKAARVAIFTVMGISILVPLIALVLNLQMQVAGINGSVQVPMPSLRINTASVVTTFVDLLFLAMAWEFLGKGSVRMKLLPRAFLTLLGVMWLDVLLFSTGAFAGEQGYTSIMTGSLSSRLFITLFATPFLWGYLVWQNRRTEEGIESRPVLAILQQFASVKQELSRAQEEIERRKLAEKQLQTAVDELREALAEVKTLQGFLPICASCKKIRNDDGYWEQIEAYISQHSDAKFSHGICPDCAQELYGDTRPAGR